MRLDLLSWPRPSSVSITRILPSLATQSSRASNSRAQATAGVPIRLPLLSFGLLLGYQLVPLGL
jgi:hypothetical protein